MFVTHERRLIEHPDDPAVLGEHPVLQGERLAGLVVARVLGERTCAIVGMKRLGPQIRVGEPFLLWIPEEGFDLWTHVDGGGMFVHGVDVRDGGDVFDDGSVLLLGEPPGLLDPLPLDRRTERAGRGTQSARLHVGPVTCVALVVEPEEPPPFRADEDRHGEHASDPLAGQDPSFALRQLADAAADLAPTPEHLDPSGEVRRERMEMVGRVLEDLRHAVGGKSLYSTLFMSLSK